MSKQLISGRTLMKRWNMDKYELLYQIQHGLAPLYLCDGDWFEVEDISRIEPSYGPELLFRPQDIEKYEEENDWIVSDDNRSSVSGKEAQELGRLRKEKAKWNSSIVAAVQIGLSCGNLEERITRAQLQDKVYEIDSDIPNTVIDKIWKALPENVKQQAGRPPKA